MAKKKKKIEFRRSLTEAERHQGRSSNFASGASLDITTFAKHLLGGSFSVKGISSSSQSNVKTSKFVGYSGHAAKLFSAAIQRGFHLNKFPLCDNNRTILHMLYR